MKSSAGSGAAQGAWRDRILRGKSDAGVGVPTRLFPASRLARRSGILLIGAVLAGCAQPGIPTNQNTDATVLLTALRERDRQVNALLDEAERLRAAGQFQEAIPLLAAANRLDPTNERGR